ncbi:MAG: hypothetical protein Q8R02_23755 [Hyphomonadaceae bacterium]|nr:hypothetical protein [Hyphomonadaceae bacterium]
MTKRKRSVPRIGPESMRRARKRPVINDFPEPIWNEWEDPPSFGEALDLQMRRHCDGAHRLCTAIAAAGDTFNWATIRSWRRGQKEPQSVASLEILGRIETRYRLPLGYFRSKLGHSARATTGLSLPGVRASERRRLIWHLPDDYDRRSQSEQREILDWVRRVIISGSTEYRRFQALAIRDRYAIRFKRADSIDSSIDDEDDDLILEEPELAHRLDAPASLQSEMDDLLNFKTATLTTIGYQRSGVWGAETASQKLEHLGLLFGALAAAPAGRVRGLGTSIDNLGFGLLVFPAVWDWYVQWRERRRGFYTRWEVDMLRLGCCQVKREYLSSIDSRTDPDAEIAWDFGRQWAAAWKKSLLTWLTRQRHSKVSNAAVAKGRRRSS